MRLRSLSKRYGSRRLTDYWASPISKGHNSRRTSFSSVIRRRIFEICRRHVGSRRVSLRWDRVSRSSLSCEVISSAARLMAARS